MDDYYYVGHLQRFHACPHVWQPSLIFLCLYHGIRGIPLAWLTSFLSDRSQTVHIDNASSSEIKLRYGVPQGSILSPLLFLIYVNTSLTLRRIINLRETCQVR